MPKYVMPTALKGDWNNAGRGRKIGCPSCGYQFIAYVPIKSASCPKGHRMKLLTADPSTAARMRSVREKAASDGADREIGAVSDAPPHPGAGRLTGFKSGLAGVR